METHEHTPTHEEIAKRAEEIWLERHQPTGSDLEIWLEAERQLALRSQQADYQQNPSGQAERRVASEREVSPGPLTSATAAESMVEYNISPPVSDAEAVKAALPKKMGEQQRSESRQKVAALPKAKGRLR